MCGIAGYWNRDEAGDKQIRSMTDRIAHRGPDADGIFIDKNNHFAFGHRRLSILDLSTAANQPFYSDDKRYVIVFNGEVYNYRELQEVYLEGQKLRTTADTEVILRLFIERGEHFVSLLNGMFTFAIYDTKSGKMWLYRDRVGIKPLYYIDQPSLLAFSSELKSLEALQPGFKLQMDDYALTLYLHLGYIPQPYTIYREIKKFPSGHYLRWEDGRSELVKYWAADEHYKKETIRDEEQALFQLRDLVESSVRYRMISDVPFGTFLSGGIDSSLVTAVASRNAASLSTYSIGFTESTHNEAPFARQVADHLGTRHTEFTVTEKEALEMVPQLVHVYDEPYADSSAIPTMMVSKLARQHVKMVLTGDGGDELFMGYGAYRWAEKLNNPMLWTFRSPLALLLSKGNQRMQRASYLFKAVSKTALPAHIFSQEQYLFTSSEAAELLGARYHEPLPLIKFPEARRLSPAEKQAFFDLQYYLKDDLLVKVDRASMRYGLEARVPLLDYRIVEWSLNLDQSLKMRNGTAKYLLKKLLYQYVPEELFRRPKWGFSIPLNKWLSQDLRPLLSEHLSPESVKNAGLVDPKVVNRLILAYLGGKTYLYNRVWALLALHLFMKK